MTLQLQLVHPDGKALKPVANSSEKVTSKGRKFSVTIKTFV